MALDFSASKGNSLLTQAKEKAADSVSNVKVVNLPLKDIRPNPDNDSIFNMENIDHLADSIKEEGFTGAIEVFDKGDGTYEILSGHRRYEAQLLNKSKTIPAIISPKPDEITKARKLLSSNINNRELTAMDKARAIDYYIKHVLKPSGFKGDTSKECSKFFHIGLSQIKRLRSLLSYEPELQKLIEEKELPYGAFDGARGFSKKEQLELVSKINNLFEENSDITLGTNRIVQIISGISKVTERAKKAEEESSKKEPIELEKVEDNKPVLKSIDDTSSRKDSSDDFELMNKPEIDTTPSEPEFSRNSRDYLSNAKSFVKLALEADMGEYEGLKEEINEIKTLIAKLEEKIK